MGKIRSLAPKTCPHCDASNSLAIADDRRLTCSLCGYKAAVPERLSSAAPTEHTPDDADDESANGEQSKPIFKLKKLATTSSAPVTPPVVETPPTQRHVPPPAVQRYKIRVTEELIHNGEVGTWCMAAYNTGLAHARREEWDEAVKAFKRAIENERDFLDAHLWLGRILEDPDDRRNHLSEVVVQQPNNMEAIRELMLLNGQLTEAEAERTADEFHSPTPVEVDTPVAVEATGLKCPVCGGVMTIARDGIEMQCGFCGHLEARQANRDYGLKSLGMAMLKRRGQEVLWIVGERLLKCKACGSERTLPPTQLSDRCPFCGSRHVIEKDALGSFQQPDGVLPFKLDYETAEHAVYEALSSGFERVKGWFVNNRVKHVELEGVYLPCWLFDMVLQVNRSITRTEEDRNRYGFGQHSTPVYRVETVTEMANDVPVFGIKSPPAHLLERLGRFGLDTTLSYEPGLLAKHSAQIYTVDFEAASLLARERISEEMRGKYGHDMHGETITNVQALVQNMLFRLVLMPVWVATVTEADGDLRPVLVNGQTGRVAAGKSRKP
jgi:ribosomal protein S27AE